MTVQIKVTVRHWVWIAIVSLLLLAGMAGLIAMDEATVTGIEGETNIE